MTFGLDDSLGKNVSLENLKYMADANSRLAYNNVDLKLQDIIAEASQQIFTNYFNSKLRDKIGITGIWHSLGNLNIFWSNTKSITSFGLLIFANGKWENTQIISETFIYEAVNTSQKLNNAYSYLWRKNVKSTYGLPQSEIKFSGSLIPNAPNDLIAVSVKKD